MKPQHTPTPWINPNGTGLIRNEHGGYIASTACRDIMPGNPNRLIDAAFIVRAVNAHQEILEHMKTLERIIASLGDEPMDRVVQGNCLAITRAIIAKAEGKE